MQRLIKWVFESLLKIFLPDYHLQKYPGPRKPKDKEA